MTQGPLADGEAELAVVHDEARRRYEACLHCELIGHAAYALSAGVLTIGHTEVDRRYEGRGAGAALIKAALEDVRARGLQVLPLCSFAAAYVRRHRDYADLVPRERRAQFRL
ncbi:MAG: GNAT family N-acetyltransferase [Betaproteobacteria bacterium]|nr:N-acetyltransferase [Betaproteobacteria bacterium]